MSAISNPPELSSTSLSPAEKRADANGQPGEKALEGAEVRPTIDADFEELRPSLLSRIITPRRCRWDPKNPPPFTKGLCILYALAAGFTVANLYYCQPILNRIAATFNVSYEESSQVATLLQAGYATGIIFLLPLGDLVERRPFIICLITMTATLWIGLCVTPSFAAFRAISFLCGITTVTPQLMIPLTGDFAPVKHRAFAISIIVSGVLFGMLVARVLSGVVTNFTSWRNTYWVSCGAQYILAVALYFFMPNYPSTNPGGLSYLQALWSIPKMVVTEPVLVQSCMSIFFVAAVFTSFWTTLNFLLASPPYEYSSLVIGLLSLLSFVAMVAVPLYGRFIDRFIPLMSVLIGQSIMLVCVIIGTFTGTFTIAGPIVQICGTDVGFQITQVANRASIFVINPKARNRVNTAYMAATFAGQLTGTAVGNRLYAAGGWKWSGGCSIGFVVASMLCVLARGPRETGWVGWKGGWRLRRDPPVESSPQEAALRVTSSDPVTKS